MTDSPLFSVVETFKEASAVRRSFLDGVVILFSSLVVVNESLSDTPQRPLLLLVLLLSIFVFVVVHVMDMGLNVVADHIVFIFGH